MKNLTLIRHAKSSWEYDLKDIDRPLKKSGIIDAELVSSSLKTSTFNEFHWYSSPANRAYSTAIIFAKKLNFPTVNIKIQEDLYDFGGHKLTQFVKDLPDFEENVVLYGHNHAITDFVNTYGNLSIDNVPTCGLVKLVLPIKTWRDLKPGETSIFVRPKELRP